MFTYIENNFNTEVDKLQFYNPSILGSGLKKYKYITLTQLFSSYIFAQNKTERIETKGKTTSTSSITQQIIFSFDKISVDSFQYICDMFKELQLQNLDEFIFCFYPETKEEIELINEKFMNYAINAFDENNEDKVKIVILDNRRLSPVDTK
jgi:hypothetical protein